MTERELLHDLTNKLIGITGKIKKIQKAQLGEYESDAQKAEKYAQEAMKLIVDYKEELSATR